MIPLLQAAESLSSAKTREEVEAVVAEAARLMGFPWYALICIYDLHQPDTFVFRHVAFSLPDGFAAKFHDMEESRADPVIRRLKNSSLPVIWGPEFYDREGMSAFYEEQAAFGMRFGVASAMHMPRGKHMVLGFVGPAMTGFHEAEQARLLAGFQLLMVHAEAALSALGEFQRPTQLARVEDVTRRELECLKWSSNGKTAWEVGRILSISERTVNKYMDTAAQKLQAINKTHAVAQAVRLRLIA